MKNKSFGILKWLRGIVNRFFKDDSVYYTYDNMDEAIEKWLSMYYEQPSWLKKTHGKSLNLSSAIAAEFARLIMVEFDVEINGSARADFLNEQFIRMTENLREKIEKACAVGGLFFKPYISGGVIKTDLVTQENVIPLEFTDNECVGCVFVNIAAKGNRYYWRLEKQRYDSASHTHTCTSKYFISNSPDSIGKEISAAEYPFPATVDYTVYNCDHPLFSFWRVPLANTVEKDSPMGVSVFSRAVKQIMEADKQWDRFLWEFEGGELAIDADSTVLNERPVFTENGEVMKTEMPKTKDRLFRRFFGARNKDDMPFYNVFAPALRDSSYRNGLNIILRMIEFLVGLAYGTLSDPQNVDKTAEEVKASKQRSYAVVNNMQQSLQNALNKYIYAVDKLASVCNLAADGDYEIKWNWGDGVLEDADKETQLKLQEVNSGIITKVEYLKWRYGVDKETALKMIPSQPEFQDYFNGAA